MAAPTHSTESDDARLSVLLVEDEPTDADLLLRELGKLGYALEAQRVESETEYLAALETRPDLILSDFNLPGFDGMRALTHLRDRGLDTPFILVSGAVGEDVAVEALKRGADDYLIKGKLTRLGGAVRQALEAKRARDERSRAEEVKRLAEAALRESEERFRQIFSEASVGLVITTPEGRLLECNEAFCRMVGYSQEELRDMEFPALTHPDDRERLRSLWPELLAGERTSSVVEKRYLAKDGRVVWTRVSLSVIRDSLGQPKRIIGVEEDITAGKSAQEQRNEHLTLQRIAGKLAKLGGWKLEVSPEKVIWSEQIRTILDCPPEMQPSLEQGIKFYLPKYRNMVRRNLERCITSGEPFDFEAEVQTAKGRLIWVRARGEAVRDSEGRIVALQGAFQDITARRNASETMREQAELLDKARDAILVRDLEHRILFWNKSAERMYGWTAEEALGRSIKDLLYRHPGDFLTATGIALEKGEWVGEIQQFNKTGEEMTVEGHWTLVRDAMGRPKSILAINTDITSQKRLEQQFLRVQRMEGIGTLAGGIAHDLNNVLAPIVMSIDLLRLDPSSPMNRDILDTISASARRGAEMVSQVLSFARGMEGQRVQVQLKHLIRELVKIVGDTFPKNLQIEHTIPSDLWVLKADPTQLHQVLLNLCVNARDAMPEGGAISISAENIDIDEHYAAMTMEAKVGRYVRLVVADTGTGIPREVVDKIFDPFFTTKEIGQGTGLGLSTTLAIVKSHGGFVRVYSEPGKGATFQVYLPAQLRAGASEMQVDEGRPRGSGETILVVDDEAAIRRILKQTLESFGYRVLLAENGADAVAQYAEKSSEIAAVLTDMVMPVMDGLATIRALRRINPEVRIIGASGITGYGEVPSAGAAEIRHFLPKPYTTKAVLRTIRDALNEC